MSQSLSPQSPSSAHTPVVLQNPGFDSGTLAGWTVTHGSARAVSEPVHEKGFALELGEGPSEIQQQCPLLPGRKYRLSAFIRTESGAEEARLGIRGHGKAEKVAATSWVSYRHTELFFNSGDDATSGTVFVSHPAGPCKAWIDTIELECVGIAESRRYVGMTNSIRHPQPRVPVEEMGVRQVSNERIREMLDMRFGMFIHWGLYAGPGRGEWLRYAEKIPEADYARLAYPASGDEYFVADRYDPADWARIAKAAGMRFMCLTTRHHDGYNLFPSPHPNAFHSGATHRRDFVGEFVHACRSAGLGVGLYFSPLNWRYPGVFDVYGTDCKPNNLGFTTSPTNKENARIFKEENYANLRHLLTAYGHIDYIFWDGGWLGHTGSDADAAFFHEPGRFMDERNEWPIDAPWRDLDPDTGRPLGIMGMVRRHQPDAITNSRYGWIGDIGSEEQGPPPTGPIRSTRVYDKCITMGSSWGYSHNLYAKDELYSRDLVIEQIVNSALRNMVFQLNVGPDRHGVIHPMMARRLREVGEWLEKAAPAVYCVDSGPWDPEDNEYGYTSSGNTLFVHLLKGYTGTTFTVPPVGRLNALRARQLIDGRTVAVDTRPDRTVLLTGIDRSASPVDTIIAVEFDRPVMSDALEWVG